MKNCLLFLCLIFFCQFIFSQSKYKLNARIISRNSKINVEITLKNNSNDTLKYYTMSCSWQDNYTLNTRKISINHQECDKNIPVLISVGPNETKTNIINLSPVTRHIIGLKLKIGFISIEESSQLSDIHIENKENVIWSNEIKI